LERVTEVYRVRRFAGPGFLTRIVEACSLTMMGARAITPLCLANKLLTHLFLMTDLRQEFDQAAENIQRFGVRPDNDTLLKLYALYKQGSEGDLIKAPPGFFDFIGTSKHEAWAKLHGVPEEDAMRRYIALVDQLLA
jgi:acyl-CoA-binding protein